ncbi:MAG: Alcohol dehydrogenase zinc-binding domain protein [Pedosphaera sp.]|nr:Alcohol dehydrogenase zinc-binding domain protein [Pedosphaera sp.]
MATTMTMTTTMKAVRIHSFGGPDVLRYEEVPRPEPEANEVLVRVLAAGVNPVDWKIREGHFDGVPLPSILGNDISGVVEALGPAVMDFRLNDPVFGTVADDSGAYAEYAVAPVSHLARKPASLDDVHAAALPTASLTAWQALFDAGNLQAGQQILIHAAAGGVGSFAVQFAEWKGAHVIGTASLQNHDYVRELGADEVIDYHSTKFEDVVHDVDVVFDTMGGEIQERSWKVLKPGGILVSIVQPPSPEKAQAHGVRGVFMVMKSRGDQLARIADLVARDVVKVHIEAVLPLSEARKAQEMSQSGHTRGKIVLVPDGHGD